MRRLIGGTLAAIVTFGLGSALHAEDNPNAILDKAITALGGAQKLSSIKAATWTANGKVNLGGKFTSHTTVEGLDDFRSEFETDFNGTKVRGITVLAGDKGWRQISGTGRELSQGELANEKRNVAMQIASMNPTILKDKAFKVEPAGEENVGGKSAVGLNITGPRGKDFKLYFDKKTGLPVRLTAKIMGVGNEADQEITFSDYKDFNGIKKASNAEIKRDGKKFISQNVTAFKVLGSVPADTFSEPK